MNSDVTISTDRARLDVPLVHEYLSKNAYWALGRERHVVEQSIAASLNFGIYERRGAMLGYARVVSDFATVYYLADVFVIPERQRQGLGRRLIEYVVTHPQLRALTGVLITKDAADLYRPFGFHDMQTIDRVALLRRGVSKNGSDSGKPEP